MSKLENKELKVKSFRVDEDTFAKFKEIAASEFGNQSQCLEALINIYETEESRSTLVGRQLEIESFQDYLNKISRLFITSLQMSSDAEERAKEGYLRKIEDKDKTISILQDKLDSLKAEIKTAKADFTILKQINKEFELKNKELEENKNTLSQLASRNYDLAEKLQSELDKIKEEEVNYSELSSENLSLKQEILELNNLVKQTKGYNSELILKNDKCKDEVSTLKKIIEEKVDEVNSYKTLVEAVRRDSKAEITAITDKLKEDFKTNLKEREELLKRSYELDKKELELQIKELKLKSK